VDGVKKKHALDAELAWRFHLNPFELGVGHKIGLIANLGRLESQDIIRSGDYDSTNYEKVYNLFICAYGDEKLASEAKLKALQKYVKQSCNNANNRES
jgi:hypothetical protein